MSDTGNPWQSPGTEVRAEETGGAQGGLNTVMIRYLKEASPWLRFLGILGYIGAIFVIVLGVIMTIYLAVTGSSLGGDALSATFGSFMGLIYLVGGVVSFFPARFTYRFGTKIRNYLASNADQDLEAAFQNNKALWKFNGILWIVYLAFIPIAIIGAVIAAIAASSF
jgi:hypothetical protein